MLWRIYLILETFQTASEFPILLFIILILETFIQIVHNPCHDESIQFWKHFNNEWVSHSNILYFNFRYIHTDSAHPMLKRIYLILETFQTTSEFPILIFFILILDTFIQIVHTPCYDESI